MRQRDTENTEGETTREAKRRKAESWERVRGRLGLKSKLGEQRKRDRDRETRIPMSARRRACGDQIDGNNSDGAGEGGR